jgi:hypothetical protein
MQKAGLAASASEGCVPERLSTTYSGLKLITSEQLNKN